MDLYISYITDLKKIVVQDSWKPLNGGGYQLTAYNNKDSEVHFDIANSTIYLWCKDVEEETISITKDESKYTVYQKNEFDNLVNNL